MRSLKIETDKFDNIGTNNIKMTDQIQINGSKMLYICMVLQKGIPRIYTN